MQNQKLSLVIPAYNEETILADTIDTALRFLAEHSGGDYELIISDDGSTDRTREIAQSISDAHLRVVSHTPNRGKGSAVREGILAATGDFIVCTDADLAYGLEVVPGMLTLLSGGADLAVGSREIVSRLGGYGRLVEKPYRLGHKGGGLGPHVRTADAGYAEPALYDWLLRHQVPG